MSIQEANRVISGKFIDELKTGKLKELTELMKSDNELLMCFRGKYINIYYRGHSIFKIEEQKRDYKISFNFNHAKFTEAWNEKWFELKDLGFQLNSDNKLTAFVSEKDYPSNGITLYLSKICQSDFWSRSTEILKDFMKDFFDPNKGFDYFYNIQQEGRKNVHLEKLRQQQIMSCNQHFTNGYFVYDMEFTQANKDKTVHKSGRFDMVALHRDQDRMKIVFIELKSTLQACNDNGTGVNRHYGDLQRYIHNEGLMKTRKEEAKAIYKIYEELSLAPGDLRSQGIGELDSEILFLFTDEAIKYTRKDAVPNWKVLSEGQWVL